MNTNAAELESLIIESLDLVYKLDEGFSRQTYDGEEHADKINKPLTIALEALLLLGAAGSHGLAKLTELTKHPNLYVQLYSAGVLGQYKPTLALPILTRLANFSRPLPANFELDYITATIRLSATDKLQQLAKSTP